MPISPYPTQELGGPRWNKYTAVEPDYDSICVTATYQDEGISTVTEADSPKLTWTLEYTHLTLLKAKILDDHYDEAFGQANSFSFTDREGVTHAGVRYDKGGLRRSHDKLQRIQQRMVKITKYP